MAAPKIETYNYGRSDNPQDVCDWIMSRGGRAIPVGTSLGTTPNPGIGILYDSGFGTTAMLALPGDQLSYNPSKKLIVVTMRF